MFTPLDILRHSVHPCAGQCFDFPCKPSYIFKSKERERERGRERDGDGEMEKKETPNKGHAGSSDTLQPSGEKADSFAGTDEHALPFACL